ncbi:anti-sigma factor [Microbacterium sp. ASV49]|uniref:Regulator of SigK n=1 Tax=Microbacterium candidum TaxID=3041922 RepID=A0ABT7MWD3_9MICO|nr:anti-sigma factor [Microbacterium sp. ASV49]MDL9978761.1 anti-sigma factor [Microbacterium sp. ASV49]
MTEEEFALLAAGAALGALSDDDQRAYRQALADHPQWASIADEDADTAAALAGLAREVLPPPEIRDEILARIDAASPDVHLENMAAPAEDGPTDGRDDPRRTGGSGRRWGRRGWFALAASLVLLIGVGTATVMVVQQTSQPAGIVALNRIEGAPDAQHASGHVQGGGPATLHWSVSIGKAVLVTGAMPEISRQQTFELWYMRGTAAIPAGTFDATGDSTSALLKPGMQPGDVIGVTVEQAGGSPNGRPTTDPILTIPTS